MSRLWSWRPVGRGAARALSTVAALVVGGVAGGAVAAVERPVTEPAGLVVKLRERGARPMPVVRLAVSPRVTERDAAKEARLQAIAQRRQLALQARRPTAFGAHVILPGRRMTQAEAEREAARWRADPDVEWAIVNERLVPAALPTPSTAPSLAQPLGDAQVAQQWWLARAGTGLEGVPDIREAWDRLAGRSLYPVVVAVLDSGRRDLPGLTGRWYGGYDFVGEAAYAKDGDGLDADPHDPGDQLTSADIARDPSRYPGDVCAVHASTWHGPTIGGQLGGMPAALDATSTLGVVGMLPQLGQGRAGGPLLLPVRVSGSCGASVMDVIEGMLWSAGVRYQGEPLVNPTPARVINLSFGGPGSCAGAPTDRDAAWLYRQAIAAVRSKGALVVASAGNGDFVKGDATASRPANCAGVLAVTGLSKRGLKAHYANLTPTGLATVSGEFRGTGYGGALLLPGYAGEGTAARPTAVYAAGTSFASPIVAGVAAMMLALDPSITVDELQAVLSDTGPKGGLRPHVGAIAGEAASACVAGLPQQTCYCDTATCGSGVLDAGKAVAWALDRVQVAGGAREATDQAVTASWFLPSRVTSATPSRSGGGGGAVTAGWALAWGVGLGWVALFQRRAQRQSAKRRF